MRPSPSSSRSTTSTAPRRCATRAGRPVTPRVWYRRTARSVLHTFGVVAVGGLGVSERDRVFPVVPMFHANAWGLAHASVATGATLVMPGPDLSPPAIAGVDRDRACDRRRGGADDLDGGPARARRPRHLDLRSVVCGGSAVPRALGGVARASRCADPPGVGHDGDRAARLGLPHQVDARCRARRRGPRRRCAASIGTTGARRRGAGRAQRRRLASR